MKIYEALAAAIGVLEQSGVSNPRQDAESLLEAVLGKPRTFLVAHSRDSLELPVWDAFHAKVMERTRGKPLQYILGTQEFLGMEFEVTPEVLIPRPETELLVETARQIFASLASPRIADVGTGSGCIAVSLAVLLPSAHVSAVDLSPSALEVARRNASKHRVLSRVAFRQGDLLAPIESKEGQASLDGVVSNPPYVSEREFPGLQREVRDWEPRMALLGGFQGLELYERLIPQAYRILRPGGSLLMEIGYTMSDAVVGLLGSSWDQIQVKLDYNHIPRVVVARKKSS